MPDDSSHPESRDVSPKALAVFGLCLVLFLVTALVLLALFFDTAPHWPGAPNGVERHGESPRLQQSPKADLAAFRQREQQALETLGWVDPAAGIARIPVSDALNIVSEQGFPDWGRNAADINGDCPLHTALVPRAPQTERCRPVIRQETEGRIK